MLKLPVTKTALSSRSRSERSVERTETGHEIVVSRYFQDYFDSGKPGLRYVARRPVKSLRMLGALRRLPCLEVTPSFADNEAAAIHGPLSRHAILARSGLSVATALPLPPKPGQYALGASKQTLRRKVRYARRQGITWAEVSDVAEQKELLQLADEYERIHPDERYRNPSPDNSELLGYRLWLAAYSADGRPLLLSVTPVDGELALLSYFRTMGSGDQQSNARYLMTQVLVDKLVSCGVRYLLDSGSAAMPSGLRHFQRMLGFRIVRIRTRFPDQVSGAGPISIGTRAAQDG